MLHVPPRSPHDAFVAAQEAVDAIEARYSDKIKVDGRLKRSLVSFQANKNEPFYRWVKYKEGFSKDLVQMYLGEVSMPRGTVLDPFSGAGTTLAASAEMGLFSEGIELLPMGRLFSDVRLGLCAEDRAQVISVLEKWIRDRPWNNNSPRVPLNELRITAGAYPKETEICIERYLGSIEKVSGVAKDVLYMSLIAILESISFTRKDGQYLRWDRRSSRSGLRGDFDKGKILGFDEAILEKLKIVADDIINYSGFSENKSSISKTHDGSCLDILPNLPDNYFGAVVTSPPYCNRYDYTRTYALELAVMNVDEVKIRELRQKMLSCTVENKEKDLLSISSDWSPVVNYALNHEVLSKIINSLSRDAQAGELNNPQIVRMVRGYFLEMACVIHELGRKVMSGGTVVMVNDNVRFGGLPIPVDCILSDFAEFSGFEIRAISTLPRGKGNSSQQMGKYGRAEIRKCVYVWERR